MLRAEPDTHYYIYPSWAQFAYKWEDLPRLMADPLGSGALGPDDGRWEEFGFVTAPEEMVPAKFIDGPVGGGVIVEHPLQNRWLPGAILYHGANLAFPQGMFEIPGISVVNIEPYDDPLLNYLEGKPHVQLHSGLATPENIEAESDRQFWIVVYDGVREIKGLDELPDWASYFGPRVSRLAGCPEPLREETADWFRNPSRKFVWYEVEDFPPLAGFCFAIVNYLALHLCKVGGKRMSSMHMLSGIEGKPNVRKTWPRR